MENISESDFEIDSEMLNEDWYREAVVELMEIDSLRRGIAVQEMMGRAEADEIVIRVELEEGGESANGAEDGEGIHPDTGSNRGNTCSLMNVISSTLKETGMQYSKDIKHIRKLFDCPVCYEIILPPIQLCTQGHSVCNTCKKQLQNCPSCRSPFTKIRNRIAEAFLGDCILLCRFNSSGCTVAKTATDLALHLETCEYRPILCRQCQLEVPYPNFLEHIRKELTPPIIGATKVTAGFDIDRNMFELFSDGLPRSWEVIWINAFDRDMIARLDRFNFTWLLWIGIVGPPETWKDILCAITAGNVETHTEVKYVGKVLPIRSTPQEVWTSGLCLSFNDYSLRGLLNGNGIDVRFEIFKGSIEGPDSNIIGKVTEPSENEPIIRKKMLTVTAEGDTATSTRIRLANYTDPVYRSNFLTLRIPDNNDHMDDTEDDSGDEGHN